MPGTVGGGGARVSTYEVSSPAFGKRLYETMSFEFARSTNVVSSGGGKESVSAGAVHTSPITLTRAVTSDSKAVFNLFNGKDNGAVGDTTVALLDAGGKSIATIMLRGAFISRYAQYEQNNVLVEEISLLYRDITMK